MTPERWCRWYASLEPLDATRFIAGAAPARLLFLWGRSDWFVRPRLAEALWRAAPEPKEAIWYRSGHMLPGASGDDQLQWLSGRLGLAAPPVFHGRASEYVGTYTGWGGMMDPLELGVVADSAGRLGLRGPFTGPDDPDGRLSYLGPTAEGESFRLDDKRLTFVRDGGRVTQLRIDAPIDDPRAHLVLRRVQAESPDAPH
jgi:hypothetical protein